MLYAPAQLGRQLAKRLFIPYREILRFCRTTVPQHTLNRRQRLQNMHMSVKVVGNIKVKGNWLIIDDVYTTGATVNECARALKSAGAERVEVLTLARGLDLRIGFVGAAIESSE